MIDPQEETVAGLLEIADMQYRWRPGGAMVKPESWMEGGADRRRSRRFGPREDVEVSLEGDTGEVTRGVVVDISQGGAMVAVEDARLREGETKIVVLKTSSTAVTAAVRVVWSEQESQAGKTRYGLEWTSEGYQRERLNQLIRSLLPG